MLVSEGAKIRFSDWFWPAASTCRFLSCENDTNSAKNLIPIHPTFFPLHSILQCLCCFSYSLFHPLLFHFSLHNSHYCWVKVPAYNRHCTAPFEWGQWRIEWETTLGVWFMLIEGRARLAKLESGAPITSCELHHICLISSSASVHFVRSTNWTWAAAASLVS